MDRFPRQPAGKGSYHQRPKGTDARGLNRCGDAAKDCTQNQHDENNRRDNAAEQADFFPDAHPLIRRHGGPEIRIHIAAGSDVDDVHS